MTVSFFWFFITFVQLAGVGLGSFFVLVFHWVSFVIHQLFKGTLQFRVRLKNCDSVSWIARLCSCNLVHIFYLHSFAFQKKKGVLTAISLLARNKKIKHDSPIAFDSVDDS